MVNKYATGQIKTSTVQHLDRSSFSCPGEKEDVYDYMTAIKAKFWARNFLHQVCPFQAGINAFDKRYCYTIPRFITVLKKFDLI